jgi:hypothetical protein
VETPIATAHRLPQRRRLADVAGDALELNSCQAAQIALRTQQRPDFMPAPAKFVDKVRAHKPARAGDETFHKGLPVIERLPPHFNTIPNESLLFLRATRVSFLIASRSFCAE